MTNFSRAESLQRMALPDPNTVRWVVRRKAQVVAAVRNGLLSFEDACKRYRLSEEELQSWMDLLDHHGVRGLRASRMQEYRRGDIKFCDRCDHFKPWTEHGSPPKDYNPCPFGHDLHFRQPVGYSDDFGFFRRVCADRLEKEKE